jgi:hypothetical protein
MLELMKKIPGGVVLSLEAFPPLSEVLQEILLVFEECGIRCIYLIPGRQFCWSFDDALRDADAYPEALYRGFLSRTESRGIQVVPVLTARQLEDFISAHPETARAAIPPGGAVQHGVLKSIMEGIIEDLMSVFSRSGTVAVDTGINTEGELVDEQFLTGITAAARNIDCSVLQLNIHRLPLFSGREIRRRGADLEEVVRPGKRGGLPYELPPPPGWLELLGRERSGDAGLFLESYRGLDQLLSRAWRDLRREWEGRNRRNTDSGVLQRLERAGGEFERAGGRLVLPPWLADRRRSWERAFTAALLHHHASGPLDRAALGSILRQFSPIVDVEE